MNVLVACECSQVVMKAFLEKGHNAFSCDIQKCRGDRPDRHICYDVKQVIEEDSFYTENFIIHDNPGWDLIIAHPPCTYLSNAGACRLFTKDGFNHDRYKKGLAAVDFFMYFYNLPGRVCIENPVPLTIYNLPKPTQVIQPYMFGERYSKSTYLWLKNLPPLFPTLWINNHIPYIGGNHKSGVARSQYERSKTFPGIASAMADTWG